jgi:hypothetical protein
MTEPRQNGEISAPVAIYAYDDSNREQIRRAGGFCARSFIG